MTLRSQTLIEQGAKDPWEDRCHGTLDDVSSTGCGNDRQTVLRTFVANAERSVKGGTDRR